MVTVDNLKILKALKNHEDGEVFYVKDENKLYVWQDESQTYKEIDPKAASESGLKMNLYEINKSIISQMEPLDEARLNDLKDMIDNLYFEQYYLLYGREINYFTLFVKNGYETTETLGEALISCLKSFDKVYSYEKLEDDTIEIWVEDNECTTVLYFFDYTNGVVYYD